MQNTLTSPRIFRGFSFILFLSIFYCCNQKHDLKYFLTGTKSKYWHYAGDSRGFFGGTACDYYSKNGDYVLGWGATVDSFKEQTKGKWEIRDSILVTTYEDWFTGGTDHPDLTEKRKILRISDEVMLLQNQSNVRTLYLSYPSENGMLLK